MKTNFVGLRQKNLKKQSFKHRIQGAIVMLIMLSIIIGVVSYLLIPKIKREASEDLLLKISKNEIEVVVSKHDLFIRDSLSENYEIKKINRNLIPENALKANEVKGDFVVTRKISKNSILVKDDIISILKLVPDLRRYEELKGIVDIPSGIEQYKTENQNIVVDFRFRYIDEEKNLDLDQVILSKKEIPLLIGNTIWVQLEDERERKLLNAAVKEIESGANIYLSIYTDPEIQIPAEVTYLPLEERLLIDNEVPAVLEIDEVKYGGKEYE